MIALSSQLLLPVLSFLTASPNIFGGTADSRPPTPEASSSNFGLCLGILDRLLLIGQLNLQPLQFGLLLPKGHRQFFHGPPQGVELIGTLCRDGLDSLRQLPLKAGNLVGRRLELPSVVLYLPAPADPIGVVVCLNVL